MNTTLIFVLAISSCVAIINALSCYNLELKAGRSNECYIEEYEALKELDARLVGSTPKCTSKDITQGTTVPAADGSFCYMAVFRANATLAKTPTTVIDHAAVLIERGTTSISSGQAMNCSQQCSALEAKQDAGNNVPMTRTLLYFACSDGDNSNGENVTIYKGRTEKFNCINFKFVSQTTQTSAESTIPSSTAITSQPQSKPFLPWWLIVIIVVVALLVVVAIVGAVYMMCCRKKTDNPHRNAAYRAQNANVDEAVASANP